jgi:hypothetical protein
MSSLLSFGFGVWGSVNVVELLGFSIGGAPSPTRPRVVALIGFDATGISLRSA